MSACTFSPAARRDLFDIYEYISADDEETAFAFVSEIERVCKLLATQKEIGRRRSELRKGLHTFAFRRYIIAYRQTEEGIEIARVVHGMRDLRELFGDAEE